MDEAQRVHGGQSTLRRPVSEMELVNEMEQVVDEGRPALQEFGGERRLVDERMVLPWKLRAVVRAPEPVP
jgi:hypothetical protein